MAWFINPKQRGLIIVEDQLSAIRASDRVSAVALLGVHLNDERIKHIRAAALAPVFLCLDRDAGGTSIQHAIKYGPLLGFNIKFLDKDIKNMTPEEFDTFMGGIV